jgi:hypothetical protein
LLLVVFNTRAQALELMFPYLANSKWLPELRRDFPYKNTCRLPQYSVVHSTSQPTINTSFPISNLFCSFPYFLFVSLNEHNRSININHPSLTRFHYDKMYTSTIFVAAAMLLANTVSSAPAPKYASYNGTNTYVFNTTSGVARATGSTVISSIHSTASTASVMPIIPIIPSTSKTTIVSASVTIVPSASISAFTSGVVASGTAPVVSTPTATATTASGLTLFQQLILAPNAVDRQALLADEDFVFDFTDPNRVAGVTKGDGGKIVRADHATFPALVGQGGTVAIGFLGPCGFNTPHVHPRAAELNLVVQGRLFASVTPENGGRHLNHTLSQYQMTVFPQGAVHTE